MGNEANGVIVVQAAFDRDDTMWWAQVPPVVPSYGGLFAWGDTFREARENLAQIVWATVKADNSIDPGDVSAVRIHALTRKTFPVADLQASATS